MVGRAEGDAGVRVVIYGTFHGNWMAALAPDAPVWRLVKSVCEVVIVPHQANAEIPPSRDPDAVSVMIPLLEEHARHMPKGYPSLVATMQAIDTLADKARFADFVEGTAFAEFSPKTYRSAYEAKAPFLVKRTDLIAGFGVSLVRSAGYFRYAMTNPIFVGHPVIFQEFIPGGTEYVTHAVCEDGKAIWKCTFAYTLDDPYEVKTGAKDHRPVRVATPAGVVDAIEIVTKRLGYDGPLAANFKLANGKPIFFEINPRFGGSLMDVEHVELLAQALTLVIDLALSKRDPHGSAAM